MPTGGERLVWGFGDGSDLDPVDTPYGRIGGLICWENLMPLARTAVYWAARTTGPTPAGPRSSTPTGSSSPGR